MKEAAVIVLLLGDSRGLSWELSRIRTGHLHKLVIVIPNVDDKEATRRLGVVCTGLSREDDFGDLLMAALYPGTLTIAFDGGMPRTWTGRAKRGSLYRKALIATLKTERSPASVLAGG